MIVDIMIIAYVGTVDPPDHDHLTYNSYTGVVRHKGSTEWLLSVIEYQQSSTVIYNQLCVKPSCCEFK